MDLRQHLRRVWTRAVSAQNRVKRALVDHCVERAILVLQLAHVHLFVDHAWVALFVHFRHLLLDGERDVNIAKILIAIVKHLLRQAYSITKKTNLEIWLRHHIFEALIFKFKFFAMPYDKSMEKRYLREFPAPTFRIW